MDECYLFFIIILGQLGQLFFWRAVVYEQLKLNIFKQSESIDFCNHEKSFHNAIRHLFASLTSVTSS